MKFVGGSYGKYKFQKKNITSAEVTLWKDGWGASINYIRYFFILEGAEYNFGSKNILIGSFVSSIIGSFTYNIGQKRL